MRKHTLKIKTILFSLIFTSIPFNHTSMILHRLHLNQTQPPQQIRQILTYQNTQVMPM